MRWCNMKSILILGATGMAGHVIYNYLESQDKYHLITVSHRRKLNGNTILCDVKDKEAISKLLEEIKPDILINCVGVLIKGSKEDIINTIYINSYLPHLLSQILSSFGGKLIHLSTDCVFDGLRGSYKECDFRNADDLYGRTKALGEIRNNRDLTIRTSIIGPELKIDGEGLFGWILRQNGNICGYSRVFWGGITTYELAKFVDFAISNNLTELVHATNNQKISKFNLIRLIKDIYSLKNVNLIKEKDKTLDKSLLNTRDDFEYVFPTYNQMIEEQFHFTNK